MSLTFTRESEFCTAITEENRIQIGRLHFDRKGYKWVVCLISSSFVEPDHLRQIADKLDELNGVNDDK